MSVRFMMNFAPVKIYKFYSISEQKKSSTYILKTGAVEDAMIDRAK